MLMCRQQQVEPYPLITPHPHPDWGMCVYIQVVVLSTDSLQFLQQLFTVLCEDDTVRGRYCAKDVAMLLRTVRIWVVLLAACAKFAWSQEAGERQNR